MRIARSTGAVSGALIALLGIWGALIPFVGPYFDYSFGTNTSWHYATDRLWLSILPGVLAILAGISLGAARTRVAGVFAGWLAIVAGAWFAIGPSVSLSWEHGLGPIGAPLGDSTRQTLELIGYFHGLGALIIALGAFAIGRFSSRPPLAASLPAPGRDVAVTGDPIGHGGPSVEAPTVEGPTVDSPGSETEKVEAPTVEAPSSETEKVGVLGSG
jgi:hypothetical protein